MDANVVSKLSSSAVLVNLSLSVWSGRKLDKRVSQEVDEAKSTKTRAGNYHKNLLAGTEKLDAILDKISKHGYDHLSPEEKRFLFDESQR